MSTDESGARDRAETRAARQQMMAEEGAKAMAEHRAAIAAVDEKTERLKALRLAKEAEDKAVVPAPKTAKRR